MLKRLLNGLLFITCSWLYLNVKMKNQQCINNKLIETRSRQFFEQHNNRLNQIRNQLSTSISRILIQKIKNKFI